MADTIVYTTVSKGGGIDGMDHTDKGGKVTGAYLEKDSAVNNPNRPWNNVVPVVVDLDDLALKTLNGLDPVARLAIKIYFGSKSSRVRFSR